MKTSDEPSLPADKAIAFEAEGRCVTAGDILATCRTATHAGRLYATDAEAGNVWLLRPDGPKTLLDQGLESQFS